MALRASQMGLDRHTSTAHKLLRFRYIEDAARARSSAAAGWTQHAQKRVALAATTPAVLYSILPEKGCCIHL